jgi:uncharacterized protein (DUF952 family)
MKTNRLEMYYPPFDIQMRLCKGPLYRAHLQQAAQTHKQLQLQRQAAKNTALKNVQARATLLKLLVEDDTMSDELRYQLQQEVAKLRYLDVAK